MSLSPWWERLPDRFLREHEGLDRAASSPDGVVESFAWRVDAEGLVVTVQVRAWILKGIEIRFPGNYPEGCPDVRPFPFVSISTHQYVKTGALCLELGPDNWDSELLAVDLVLSAARLEQAEVGRVVEGVPVPSRHSEPPWHRAGAASGRVLVLTPGARAMASAVSSPSTASFALLVTTPSPSQYWLRAGPADTPDAQLPAGVAAGFILPKDGWIIPETVSALAVPRERELLLRWLCDRGVHIDETSLILLPNAKPSTALRITAEGVDELYVAEVPTAGRRAPTWIEGIGTNRVGIVGLGSLGSTVAVSLARAGVRRFTVVDADLLLPENLARHAGSVAHIGMLKTDVAESLIKEVAFESVDVSKWPFDVGGALPPDLHSGMLDGLVECDIIIDATADPHAHAILAALASDHTRPLVWSEVWAGGIGGLLAWAAPGRTPCPRCVRRAYLAEFSTFPEAPFRYSGVRYETGDDEPMVASDADVGVVAAATARVSLDLLARRLDRVDPVTLFGLEPTWIFSRPFETRSVRCWADDWNCNRCWTVAEEPSETALKAVRRILG